MTMTLIDQSKQFQGRIIMVGYGTIGQCALPMLFDNFSLSPEHYIVIDGGDRRSQFTIYRERGMQYFNQRLGIDNLGQVLAPLAEPGDLLVNLSVGVDSVALADWCHQNGVVYVDTSMEPWEDDVWDRSISAHSRTEYAYHQQARKHAAAHWRADGPTAVFCHGANPGLVNHFVKAALLDIASASGIAVDTPSSREQWASLARLTGTKVIHISERDTQITSEPKRPGEFVNTWSIPGFVEEASMPVEIGWGTHEKGLPPHAHHHTDGPGNAIYSTRPAASVLLRSWVPLGGPISGLALPHSESITLSEYFTLIEDGQVSYRPTVAFAYMPCDAAMASLHETMMCDWVMQTSKRVLNDDIVSGRDELGVLLLGHKAGGWWYGSQLDIDEARRLVPGNNPTAVQVAAGAVAAALWAVVNPTRGYCEPEDLPYEQVLEVALPYLGPMVSAPTAWTPLKNRRLIFPESWLDQQDPWQFSNFLLR
ncbi:MAG: saccharopine dehydrogenase NADP-binding domain-containing protein [Gammaproteobacteria bacterium]|nr:saccharopine dehydrogenase NADP-binding domain-containing protein [Gammaproteobacteria bacterium]